jgi:predicted membrane-bound spermidine synthase
MKRNEEISGSVRAWLLLAAFAAGFAITGIEIALGRLLAPHFGSSLTVWAAIIASVIGALSVGYPLGGWLADRRPNASLPLYTLLMGGVVGTALGVVLPLWLRTAMAGVGFTGGGFWGRLSLVLLLFAVPCILLAMVAPSVLRVTLRDRTTAGRDAGWLYALGSVGSVLGILIPALWTIPMLGLRWTFLLIGGVAVLAAGLGLIALGRTGRFAALLLAGLGWMGLVAVPEAMRLPEQAGVQVLYDRDSGLQRIRVVAEDRAGNRRRWLQLNEGWSIHSWYLEPDYVTRDVWDWMALTALFPQPDDGRTDVLIVGLAAGTVSNLMTLVLEPLIPGLAITGIEIDPEVIAVADRYLGLDRSHLETVVADGRAWLRGNEAKFDLIILDAYRQPSIPAHLATVEYFEEVRAHLSSGGLAVMNVFGPAGRSRLLDGLGASWAHVFPNPQILLGPEFSGMASHLLFGGPAVPLDTRRHAYAEIPHAIRQAWKLLQGVRSYRADPEVALWTDDRAPVELLTDHAYRKLRPRNAEL